MIAADIADLISARKIGKGIWESVCPVCGLGQLLTKGGIRERAVLSCENNCDIGIIVKALKIPWQAFVENPAPPPKFSSRGELDAWLAEERERQQNHREASTRRLKALEIRRKLNNTGKPMNAYQTRKFRNAFRELIEANQDELAYRAPGRAMSSARMGIW